MHTTKVLRAADFQYWHINSASRTATDFAAFCPQYHIQDRVGVVVPSLDMGVYQTGCALLALTTAFYDVLRQGPTPFFDYPHHFAFLDVNADGVATHGQRLQLSLEALGGPWGALDVWPESNWIVTPGSIGGMLKKVFDWQINRLFWPEDFLPGADAAAFPDYVRKLLSARLKTVYYYNTAHPTLEIHVTQPVEDMLQRSLSRLPQGPDGTPVLQDTPPLSDAKFPYLRGYRPEFSDGDATVFYRCRVRRGADHYGGTIGGSPHHRYYLGYRRAFCHHDPGRFRRHGDQNRSAAWR